MQVSTLRLCCSRLGQSFFNTSIGINRVVSATMPTTLCLGGRSNLQHGTGADRQRQIRDLILAVQNVIAETVPVASVAASEAC